MRRGSRLLELSLEGFDLVEKMGLLTIPRDQFDRLSIFLEGAFLLIHREIDITEVFGNHRIAARQLIGAQQFLQGSFDVLLCYSINPLPCWLPMPASDHNHSG